MQTSENINDLAAALSKAQAQVKAATKDAKNDHFKASYADLASVWDACREALTANGLSVVQAPSSGVDGAVCVTTRLMHSSGQWMEEALCCRPMKNDAQGVGSVITYLRRYSLAAMVGVAPEDDDGEGAVGRGKQGQPMGDIAPRPDGGPKDKATKDADWTGPLNKTDLQNVMRAFGRDLEACGDLDTYHGLMASKVTVKGTAYPMSAIHEQCKADLPTWWYGNGGDIRGAEARIREIHEHLAAEDARRTLAA